MKVYYAKFPCFLVNLLDFCRSFNAFALVTFYTIQLKLYFCIHKLQIQNYYG
jgi:hypothetical protein